VFGGGPLHQRRPPRPQLQSELQSAGPPESTAVLMRSSTDGTLGLDRRLLRAERCNIISQLSSIEQDVGLLICGFGVQVPGGAPVLNWGFTAPGDFLCARFVSVVARVHGPNNPGLVKNGPSGAACGGTRPGTTPPRLPSAVSGSLDQWCRPSMRATERCPSPYARPASITDTTGVNNIITNNNFSGPSTVNLSGTYALEVSVGCTWSRVNS
jgi:hypothetical protein